MTKGARDMLSTPPAINREASPVLMARAATEMASMLEPHRRLTVAPGTVCGKPAEQQRHSGDISIVFASLVGASQNHIIDRIPIHRWIALDEGLDRNGGEVIGADGRQASRRSGRTVFGLRHR